MRRKDESKKPIIVNYINDFFYEHEKIPTVHEIVNGTGAQTLFGTYFQLNPFKVLFSEILCKGCPNRIAHQPAFLLGRD